MAKTNQQVDIAVLKEQINQVTDNIKGIQSDVREIKDKLDDSYVKKVDFDPVKDAVDDLKLWQAKVAGIALACAAIVDLLIRIFLKS